jgi:membrane protease YdiL (CAAX protease family)
VPSLAAATRTPFHGLLAALGLGLGCAAGAAEPPAADPAPATAAAADPQIALDSPNVLPALMWSLLPGGGHFYLGDIGEGLAYATLAGGFIAGGIEVQRRNEDLDRDDDEVNVSFLAAQKVIEFGMFTATRKALERDGLDLRAAHMDDTPSGKLLAAPFSRSALRWEVAVAGLLGVAGGVLAGQERDTDQGRHSQIDQVEMFGGTYERDEATRMYGASAFTVSLGAAAGEEGLFRGLLQPVMQERYGPQRGLWAASGMFGAAHLVGLEGEVNVGGAIWATGAGAYLGWLYDKDGARLAAPIAAHFWYDFLLLTTLWATNPDENPFGFEVGFDF